MTFSPPHHPSTTPSPVLAGRNAELGQLQDAVRTARTGRASVVVLCGPSGSGRTTLLDAAAAEAHDFEVRRLTGVRAERELPYAGLQLLCAAFQTDLDALDEPFGAALRTAVAGTEREPDAYLVGLATHAVLTAPARPTLYLVDDAHWLDPASARALAFALRRLDDQPIAVVLAEDSDAGDTFAEFPGVELTELSTADAYELLQEATFGGVDDVVLRRIAAEVQGNPRAVLTAAAAMTCPSFAAGYGVERVPLDSLQPHLARFRKLPAALRQLLVLAAAEPTGDPALLCRAAATIDASCQLIKELEDQGWLRLGAQVLFADPGDRAAVYRSASGAERDVAHRALAAATDTSLAPDRRAWHLASAVGGVDDELAAELERCAELARDRCGLPGAAGFLERSTLLTPDPEVRTRRALTAAAAKLDAGRPTAAAHLLTTALLGRPDPRSRARLDWLQARVAFAEKRNGQAAEHLLRAALADRSSATALEALTAAEYAGRFGPGPAAVADKLSGADSAVGDQDAGASSAAADRAELVAGLGARFGHGYAAGHTLLTASVRTVAEPLTARIAADLWDDELWAELAKTSRQQAEATGNLAALPPALTAESLVQLHSGQFDTAQRLVDRIDAVDRATHNPPYATAALLLHAWRGVEAPALAAIDRARREATARGDGHVVTAADLSAAVLHNGLGQYDAALTAATAAVDGDMLVLTGWGLVELVEAAVRADRRPVAERALAALGERAHTSGTDWARGVEARSRALLADDAEPLYQEALEYLARTRIVVQLARTQLLYGEWLRREGRRAAARTQLRAAHDSLTAIGATAFADRADREHLATGERVRRRVDRRSELTPQEASIAALAEQGLTNPEIGSRLFLSPRTVEYHLHKVFEKLGINSRRSLTHALRTPR